MRLLLDVAQPPIAYRRIEKVCLFSAHRSTSTKKLAHRSHDNLFGFEAAPDFNRVTSATIAELYRMADSASMYSQREERRCPILEMCVARSMDFPD